VASAPMSALVLELLQQLKVIVAGNAEQVANARLLKMAKQEVVYFHSSAGAAGHYSSFDYFVSRRVCGAIGTLRESSSVKSRTPVAMSVLCHKRTHALHAIATTATAGKREFLPAIGVG